MCTCVICAPRSMSHSSGNSSTRCGEPGMSWKNVPDVPSRVASGRHSAWSLAARLTAWYAGSAFALVFATTGFLYWTSIRNLDRADDQLLGTRVRELRKVLLRAVDVAAVQEEVAEEWETHER